MAQLHVMTFNVRQMDGDDGEHSWEFRKDVLIETIQSYRPELLGTQETFPEQSRYILESCPQYAAFGRGRWGDERDKHCKVFYCKERLELLDCGEIWISETPEVAGSVSWGIPKPRMITWGRLLQSNGSELVIINTHLPYGRGADEARRETVRLICEKLESLPQEMPILVTGDFNAAPDGEVYRLLGGELLDAWISAEEARGPAGTLHGFGRMDGRRMDWILHRNVGRVVAAETVTYTNRGLYPSDHYPVCATFEEETR